MDANSNEKVTTVDEYIAQFKDDEQKIKVLNDVRAFIIETIPQASEKISWNMPTYYDKKNIIHFAMHKNHLGIYPGPKAIEALADDLAIYKTSKGAVQLPLDKPLPKKLIEKMILLNLA